MKKVFLYVVVGITLLAIPATIFLVGQNSEMRKRAAPASQLSLTPSNLTKKVGDTFTLEVQIDTADNQVTTAQIHITYDYTKLQAVGITNGTLAPRIVASGSVDPGSGKAAITVGAADTAHPIHGVGTIATLTMKAIAASATPISINFTPLPDTYAAGLTESGKNVIIGTVGSKVTILNADGTPAAATTSLTGTGTTTPTLTPTPALAIGGFAGSTTPTASGSASPSGTLQILSPTVNENVPGQVTIEGKGPPGSTITLTIHSTNPQTVVVTVDANGNWTYTPDTTLGSGPHTVVALATDPNSGSTQTTTTQFVVASGSGAEVSSQSAIPATGTVENTIIFIVIGLFLFLSGALLPVFIQ